MLKNTFVIEFGTYDIQYQWKLCHNVVTPKTLLAAHVATLKDPVEVVVVTCLSLNYYLKKKDCFITNSSPPKKKEA